MPSLMDLFAECDSCGGREFECPDAEPACSESELICVECGMAFVAVAPAAGPAEESRPTERDGARAA